jgi:hypothetical protein
MQLDASDVKQNAALQHFVSQTVGNYFFSIVNDPLTLPP